MSDADEERRKRERDDDEEVDEARPALEDADGGLEERRAVAGRAEHPREAHGLQEPTRLPTGRTGYPTDLNAYVHVGADGTVTCLVGKIEMGQGPISSLPQMMAPVWKASSLPSWATRLPRLSIINCCK